MQLFINNSSKNESQTNCMRNDATVSQSRCGTETAEENPAEQLAHFMFGFPCLLSPFCSLGSVLSKSINLGKVEGWLGRITKTEVQLRLPHLFWRLHYAIETNVLEWEWVYEWETSWMAYAKKCPMSGPLIYTSQFYPDYRNVLTAIPNVTA